MRPNVCGGTALQVLSPPLPCSYVHAEVKGGGLPDWVQAVPGIQLRSNTSAFMGLAAAWYAAVAAQVGCRESVGHRLESAVGCSREARSTFTYSSAPPPITQVAGHMWQDGGPVITVQVQPGRETAGACSLSAQPWYREGEDVAALRHSSLPRRSSTTRRRTASTSWPCAPLPCVSASCRPSSQPRVTTACRSDPVRWQTPSEKPLSTSTPPLPPL